MIYIAAFFAGAFLCNALPHLVAGLQGVRFPTPFARPRGIGTSLPIVNFLWGFFNLLEGGALLWSVPLAIGLNSDFAALVLGALALGTYLSLRFAKVRGETPPVEGPRRYR